MEPRVEHSLREGVVVPACPLALTRNRRWDQRRQRALLRYYSAAGVGGMAMGVHTTQFQIRDPKVGLFRPVLELAAEELNALDRTRPGHPLLRVGGICGPLAQACREAAQLRELGYQLGLLSLAGHDQATEEEMLDHCRAVGEIIPLFGFYLQPAVGGRVLPHSFWRRFVEIKSVRAIKVAPFNRYQTLDVVRAVAEAGRDDIALYTGNDDAIVQDLLTPYRFAVEGREVRRWMVGGLLGHWAFWTRPAVQLLERCRAFRTGGEPIPPDLLQLGVEITDLNAAVFDAAHGFAGCIPGIHEMLRRQGLLEATACLDPHETLSPGQVEEIDRVCAAYPHLSDDAFVREHLEEWLKE